jgi:hypothetical protein
MTDELVAYLLDDLCPERRAEVERRLQSDAAWRGELERLRECLAATGDPARCVDEPPRDLVRKTCCFVERVGAAPASVGLTPAAARSCSGSNWSLADVTVGGGVLLTLGMLMLPAMRESRDAARRAVCENNLRVLSSALFDYQTEHAHRLPRVAPGESSGEFVLELVESGVISREALADALVCPDSKLADDRFAGRANWHIPLRQELDAAQGDERRQLVVWLGGTYAYRSGYFDPDGTYRQVQYTGDTNEPVMADAPRISSSGVRSANHGGCGQYVMYQGHCVRFRANSDLAADVDNIYLNQDGEHAAGLDRWDVVLIKSGYGPAGRLD